MSGQMNTQSLEEYLHVQLWRLRLKKVKQLAKVIPDLCLSQPQNLLDRHVDHLCAGKDIFVYIVFQKSVFVARETEARYVQMVGDGRICLPTDGCQ